MSKLFSFFLISSITTTQLFGYPLYYISKDWYQVWMNWTKELFGILLIFNTQILSPLNIHISHNQSMEGSFTKSPVTSHLVSTALAERAIIISNHTLYTDWIYFWWVAYTAKTHGNIFIMLKKSLRKIPIWGWGMQNYKFIFLSRSWKEDEKTLNKSLSEINSETQYPAWLLMFPEGTTLSTNGVRKTTEFAKKSNPPLKVPKWLMIPRSTGLRYSLEKLHESVEYLYDVTIYYDGIPDGQYGEDYYSLLSMTLKNRYSKNVHMYWRRFRVDDIPWNDPGSFEKWIRARWEEKDLLLDSFHKTGSFKPVPRSRLDLSPSEIKKRLETSTEEDPNYVSPEIKVPIELDSLLQVFNIFVVPITAGLIANLAYKAVTAFSNP